MIKNNYKNRLIDFVDLNEKIKQIISLALDVELMSMNALLANKHANSQSGFAAVSYEMRSFSADVIKYVKQLSTEFSLMIYQISLDSNINRKHRIFNETQSKNIATSQYLSCTQSMLRSALKSSNLNFTYSANNANKLLSQIDRLILEGGNLSRVGKIESTYIGKYGVILYQISQDVGNIIVRISQLIMEVKNRVDRYIT